MKKAQVHSYVLPSGMYIERRSDCTWAVVDGNHVLDKSGSFVYEPLPSSRSEEFLEATRYNSAEEAYEAWETFV